MPLLTFNDIQTSLTKASPFVVFTCINVASDESSARCPNSNGLSLDKAREILAKGKSLLSLKTLREFVRCLLCEEDQPYCETVVSSWAKELGIALKGRRPKRSITPLSGSSYQASSRPPSSAKSKGPSPSAREDSGTPCPPRQHESEEPPGLDNPSEDQTAEDNDRLRSVSASKRAYHRRIREINEDAASAEIPTEDPESTDTLAGVSALEVDDANSANESDYDSTASPAVPIITEDHLKHFTEDFRRGDAFHHTPEAVRHRLLELFLRPLEPVKSKSPSKTEGAGWVYAAAVKGYTGDIVKIGRTCSIDTRLKTIQRDHGVIFDFGDFGASPRLSQAQLNRLEALVFAELAQFQLLRRKFDKSCDGPHREYYAIDLDTAKTTIHAWAQRMEHFEVRAGASVDTHLADILWHRSFQLSLQQKHTQAKETRDGPSCHEKRQRIWKAIFQDDSGGIKANLLNSKSSWFFFGLSAACAIFIGTVAIRHSPVPARVVIWALLVLLLRDSSCACSCVYRLLKLKASKGRADLLHWSAS